MTLIDDAIDHFRRRFGRTPERAAAAPGRVNLIGEHTDYSEGFVLPIAIDRETVVVAAKSNDASSTFVAADLGREIEIDLTEDLAPIPRGEPHAFANYVLGVVQQFRDRGHATPNLDLLVKSSVPIGAGLSSSASVEVAMATLLEGITGVRLKALEKVMLCQRAEHTFPGTPCGVMDMYIATCAAEHHALLIDCRSNQSTPIPLPPPSQMSTLIADTGVRHELAGGEYAERRDACVRAAAILGVPSLRDATPSMIDEAARIGSIDETDAKRASHVVFENVRTLLAASALEKGDVAGFCTQMFESHRSLRDLYEVSCDELDVIVDAAATMREATGDEYLGARMTGGGFGGCAIVCCRMVVAEHVTNAIRIAFEAAFGRTPLVFLARASGPTRAIDLSSHHVE